MLQMRRKDFYVDLWALLKSCARNKDLHGGISVHDDILRRGLLDKFSDALIIMYAKCGALVKAKELFDMHQSRNIRAWTALIAAYVEKGQGQDAIDLFEWMLHEGLSPDAVTFTCILQACGSTKIIDRGEKIHDEVVKQGLLRNDVVLGNTLVDMYAKCGEMIKARQVLEGLPVRNVISWTTLIAGYAEFGDGTQALRAFDEMQSEGISPNSVTLICVLKACGSIKAADKGKRIHDEISKQGLLGTDLVLSNALLDMYAKCGALAKAQQVLEQLPIRDVIAWNSLISGYIEQGEEDQALICFDKMRQEGLSPDAVTFTLVLRACSSIRAVDNGEKIHDEIAREGLLRNSTQLRTALVEMYAHCGAFVKARQLLKEISVWDINSWNALISGYVYYAEAEKAFHCFQDLLHKGLSPNAVTFIYALKSLGSIRDADKGDEVYDLIAKGGLLDNNIMLGNAIVDMYAKCGALPKARRVLEELPARDVISWNCLMAGYAQQGDGEHVLNCFVEMQREGVCPDAVTLTCILKACGTTGACDRGKEIHDWIVKQGLLTDNVVLGNALVDMYAKCGNLAKARQVLEELPVRDVLSWNALITGYVDRGEGEQALGCFEAMLGEGLSPDARTFIGILKACGALRAVDKGTKIHELIRKQGMLAKDIILGTAVVDMYAKCGALAMAAQVHMELPTRNVVSWSALIFGYVQRCQSEEALTCFEVMQSEGLSPDRVTFIFLLKACGSIGAADKGEKLHNEIANQGVLGSDLTLGNTLVNMYAKCGALAKARGVLEELPVRDVFSWNALIAGYAESGESNQALKCYERMQREGISPDGMTFSCLLKVCGSIGAADEGEKLQDEIVTHGLLKADIALGNAIVDMYAKCGALLKARQALEELPIRNVISWNALITGYTQLCKAVEALDCFEEMLYEGLFPDAIMLSSVLSACSRGGLLEDAGMLFLNMSANYGVKPDLEHYTCMVELFGRAGHLDKAVGVIERMPSPSIIEVWLALLGACQKLGDVALGRWVFEWAVQVDEKETTVYVLMSSIYSAAGMVDDAQKVDALRVKNKAWKKPAQKLQKIMCSQASTSLHAHIHER